MARDLGAEEGANPKGCVQLAPGTGLGTVGGPAGRVGSTWCVNMRSQVLDAEPPPT